MEIKSLENTCFGTLFEAFGQAFADYEVQLDETQLRRMLRRRGFDPRLSFAAFDGERIAAFTLNGRGNFNGLPTAYDTGTGTLEAYRGQGLAAKVFEHSIPYLREAGIRQYLLEVLQHNTKAVSVYRKLGFETAREFNYSIQQGAHVHLGAKIPDIACTVTPVDVGRFAPDPQFWDFMPSWQNSPEAIRRAAGDFAGLSARAEGTQVGYCIFEPASGDIALIAVDKRYRRRGIATSLLRRGSLEDYVGNREIAADARTLYASHGIDKAIVDCNPIALERAALAGDEVAEQVWRDLAVKLSCALMNCCYLLNPEAIIIGGGVAKAKTLLFQPLQEIMKAQLAAPLVEYLEILPAQFGTEAGILGAAHLALNTHFGETFRA